MTRSNDQRNRDALGYEKITEHIYLSHQKYIWTDMAQRMELEVGKPVVLRKLRNGSIQVNRIQSGLT